VAQAQLSHRQVITVLAVALLTLFPAVGYAHARLVKSDPPARTTIARAPEAVRLWFNERLEPAYSSASVWSAAGSELSREPAAVDAADPKLLKLKLPPLAPGRYQVRYRVLSVDGHVVEDSFFFTLREPLIKSEVPVRPGWPGIFQTRKCLKNDAKRKPRFSFCVSEQAMDGLVQTFLKTNSQAP
jgi:methionine-rich copper-binding protein CopC